MVIATPSHPHAPQTMETLKSGKNVVCEETRRTWLEQTR
ncbi:MAG: hypothetical protein FGF52_04660 [Candidatus Brockarchaeota archaeon]|nr:hypothetical protein [Candidatus Brockarchaeota archaeon]